MSPPSPSLKRSIRWLLEEKYSYSPSQVIDFFQKKSITLPKAIKKDIDRIIEGEPVAYVIGHIKFLGCHLDLSFKPLIPRPETEYWLEKVINSIDPPQPISVLDLCCGSGCLGIAALKNLSQSQVDFVDISPEAIAQTKINLSQNHISQNRYKLFKSDLFSSLPPKKYDLILTNPPYINQKKPFSKDLRYEPKIALFAPEDGLYFIKTIIDNFPSYLKPDGKIYLEFDSNQKQKIKQYCQSKHYRPKFKKDQFGYFRYLCLTHTADSL
jgi:release factor-specific protein-(glutamine-N5) methyltransferase